MTKNPNIYLSFLILLVFMLLGGTAPAEAQQSFRGKLDGNTHWSGIVRISGDVLVPVGVTLTIAAGTRIHMKPRADESNSGKAKKRIEFTVAGQIIANGEPGEGRIIFTSEAAQPQMNDWSGITIKSRKQISEFRHCLIEYAYKGITTYRSSPRISDCEIRYNEYAGISSEVRASPIIQNCSITGNGFAGIICELASFPVVEQSIITQNSNGIIIFDRSQIDLGHNAPTAGQSVGANYIFNNFEKNIYNRSSNDIYAQNNLWNDTAARQIQATLYDQTVDAANGRVIFLPLFESGRDVSRIPPLASQTRNIPTASQQRPASTPGRSQPVAQNNRRNNSTDNSSTASNPVAQNTSPAANNRANSSRPSGNSGNNVSNAQSGTTGSTPANGNRNNSTSRLNDTANARQPNNSGNSGNNPVNTGQANNSQTGNNSGNLAANNNRPSGATTTTPQNPATTVPRRAAPIPANTAPARPKVEEPIKEFLLDSGKREYIIRAAAKYPGIYRETKHQGKVLLEVVVGRDGKVASHRLLKSDGELFTEAAIEALKNFRYKPGKYQGRPVSFTIVEPFIFRIQ